MSHRRLRWSAATFVLLAGFVAAPSGQTAVTTGRDTMRMLPGVEIVVENPQPELERAGLTAAVIRGDVEKRLRAKGITIYTTQESNPSAAKPYLYVHLNALEIPKQNLYVVAVQVHLRQTVRSLATYSNVVDAMTWDSHNVVGVPTKELGTVRDEIAEHVDRFVSDWTSVH